MLQISGRLVPLITFYDSTCLGYSENCCCSVKDRPSSYAGREGRSACRSYVAYKNEPCSVHECTLRPQTSEGRMTHREMIIPLLSTNMPPKEASPLFSLPPFLLVRPTGKSKVRTCYETLREAPFQPIVDTSADQSLSIHI